MDQALVKVIDAVFGALDLFRFWVVLYEGEQGVILRFGQYSRTLGPGLHWRAPFRIEELRFTNVRARGVSSWDMSHGVDDNKVVTFSCGLVVAVSDIRFVLLNLESWKDFAYTEAGICCSRVMKRELIGRIDAVELEEKTESALKKRLAENGIRLVSFSLVDTAVARPFKLFMGANN